MPCTEFNDLPPMSDHAIDAITISVESNCAAWVRPYRSQIMARPSIG